MMENNDATEVAAAAQEASAVATPVEKVEAPVVEEVVEKTPQLPPPEEPEAQEPETSQLS